MKAVIAIALFVGFSSRTGPVTILPCARPPLIQPARCTIVATSLITGSDLRHLHWTNWGTARATATGCETFFHPLDGCRPARLVAYDRQGGPGCVPCGGNYAYLRLRETVNDHGRITRRLFKLHAFE